MLVGLDALRSGYISRNYWLQDLPGFLRFFFSKCFTEPDSEPQIQHLLEMGMQTNADVLLATAPVPESERDQPIDR